ncbi:MAG: PqqD family protein [Bacteroidetes bacterium]|nr:PqqD family protein [Bacteroidota bacterium]
MKIKPSLAISDTGFVFDPETGDSFSLNPVGSEMLKLLKDEFSVNDIKKHILRKYQTDDATVEKDLLDFINMLRQFQLNAAEDEN